jgi:elongation factor 1-gamma
MSTFVGAVTDSIESVGKNKLYGYRFSPTVQEVLHTIELTKAPITLEDISWDDEARRAEILPKAPTQTLPLLETDKGLLSQSKAIELYLVETYKPDMYGTTPIEKALINQWIDFATQEIYTSSRPLVYPIFGWMEHDKDLVNESGKELLNNLKIVDKHLEGKKYLVGDKMTLADVVLVNKIRLLFMMIYTDGLRTHQLKNLNDYFISIMETPEAKKAYGRTLLCKQPVRAYIKPKEDKKKEEKKKEEKKKEEKKEKKEKEEDEEEKPKKKTKKSIR